MLVMWRRTLASMAKTVVIKMCTDDAGNSNDQERNFELNKELFQYQEDKTKTKNQYRAEGAVMFYIAMKQGIGPHNKRQGDHPPLKKKVMNDIDTENRQG